MKHYAAFKSARERYISRREEILNNFLRIFHYGCCTVHTRFEPWRGASYAAIWFNISNVLKNSFKFKDLGSELGWARSVFSCQVFYNEIVGAGHSALADFTVKNGLQID